MEFNQDQFQLAIQRSKELTSDSTGHNNSTKRMQSDDLNLGPAKKSNEENMEIGTGLSVIVELIDIPMDVVGLVIGKQGSQIKLIQGRTGCLVQMGDPSHKPGYRQVTLQGVRHQIEHAKSLINDIITNRHAVSEKNNNGSSRPTSRTGDYASSEVISVNVLIPKECCGSLVGKGGENIKFLQEQLGVKLGLIQSTKEAIGPKPLQITGYPDNVANAQRYIAENFVNKAAQNGLVLGDHLKNNMYAKKTTFQLIVPRDSVGRIIGKNGQAIKGISKASGARVQFNLDEDQDAPERTVIIQGSINQVNHAARLVRDFCSGPQPVFLHVPADKAGLIIGKSGQTVKQIIQESGANIQISKDSALNPQERIFEITGDPTQLQQAIQMIKVKIGDLPPAFQNMASSHCGGNAGSLPTMMNMVPIQPYQAGMSLGNFANSNYQLGAIGAPSTFTSNVFGQSVGDSSFYGQVYNPQQLATYQAQPNYASIVQNTQPQNFTSYASSQLQPCLPQQQQIAIQAQSSIQAQTMAPYQIQTQQILQANTQINSQMKPQADYSAQWVQFYRDMGMHEQANNLELKIKDHQAQKFEGNRQLMEQQNSSSSYLNMLAQPPQSIQSIQGPIYSVIGQ